MAKTLAKVKLPGRIAFLPTSDNELLVRVTYHNGHELCGIVSNDLLAGDLLADEFIVWKAAHGRGGRRTKIKIPRSQLRAVEVLKRI
jgi:hypothetical protein